MKRVFLAAWASVLALVATTAAMAQDKPPLKLGGILDMSVLYTDITGPGSEMAARGRWDDYSCSPPFPATRRSNRSKRRAAR
jgi:branched-chain amino acid transport system substrate-binding protein